MSIAPFSRLEDELLAWLERIEWSGCDGEAYGGCSAACPVCHGAEWQIYERPFFVGDVRQVGPMRGFPVGGHTTDCELANTIDYLRRRRSVTDLVKRAVPNVSV